MSERPTLAGAFTELEASGGVVVVDPDHTVTWTVTLTDEHEVLMRIWAPWLAIWYWRSPSAIRQCAKCGELQFAGKRTKKKCYMPRCDGGMEIIEPPIEGRRPRRKRVKL